MGKMIRCPQGHFFDQEKHDSCPWCSLSEEEQPQGQEKTRKLDLERPHPPTPPPSPVPSPAGGPKTRRLDQTEDGIRPVMGWLVCVEGPDKGSDYRLHTGKNFLGRDPSMDVCIRRDRAVSRLRHAVVTFEPKKGAFWLQPGDSEGLVYLDDELVSAHTQIAPDQVIEVGDSRLVLVPFDKGKYTQD